jgi:hypothetical protein
MNQYKITYTLGQGNSLTEEMTMTLEAYDASQARNLFQDKEPAISEGRFFTILSVEGGDFVENGSRAKLSRVNFYTNIKGLPEGEYFTGSGYSDSHAYKVVKSTAKTKTLIRVEVEKDSEFKPEFHAGGFSAHCSNQRSQTWIFNKFCTREIVIRLNKKGWQYNGSNFLGNSAVEFYDYNF